MNHATLFLISKALGSPLEALFSLLIFIVSKEIGTTPFQLAVFASVKPVTSFIAFLISSFAAGRQKAFRIILGALLLIGALPCLYFPFLENSSFYIAAFALYITSVRASSPLWIELIHESFSDKKRAIFAKGSCLNYLTIMVVPLAASQILDSHPHVWKWLFFGIALFQLIALFPILFIKPSSNLPVQNRFKEFSINPSFFHYLLLFFLGGAGLVMLQAFIPRYFNDVLHLSYTQLTIAFCICKSAAFLLSSPLFLKWNPCRSLFFLNEVVNCLSLLFIVFLVSSQYQTPFIYLAYFLYGAMQAGCELSFNLSGPVFAKNDESTFYSGINHGFIGLRGCICPFLGQWIFGNWGFEGIILVAALLCLSSLTYALIMENRSRTELGNSFTF